MARAGIRSGDVLVVDRSLKPQDGSIVVASVHGEFQVRQLRIRDRQPYLVATDARMKPIELGEDAVIWGTVTFSIHATHPGA